MKISLRNLSFWLWPLLWAALIFCFSSFPAGSTTQVYWQDFIVKKLAHVTEYAILTLLTYRAFLNNGVERIMAIKYAIILSIFYGATDEIHQSFTPGREPTVRDVLFDTIGALLTGYFLWKLLPKAPTRLKKLAVIFRIN